MRRYFLLFCLAWALGPLAVLAEQACLKPSPMSSTELPQHFYDIFLAEPGENKAGSDRPLPYLISSAELRANSGAVLVDLRAHAKGSEIPGAITLAPQRLTRSESLKGQHLVLVDEIYRLPDLHLLAARLQSLGFKKVQVLADGIASLPAAVSRASADTATAISTERLWLARAYPWLIVDINSGESVPAFLKVIQKVDPKNTKALIGKLSKEMTAAGEKLGILLVDRDGREHKSVYQKLPESLKPYAYHISGGVENFNRWMSDANGMVKAGTVSTAEKLSCLGVM